MITTTIEKALLAIDQGTFQKMMNHLLHLEGYKFIGSPGSVIGKNKTSKGSPDSFFEDGDKYAFCEFTTHEKISTGVSFFKKLKADVDHCFVVSKTGIAKEKISKVILAFTNDLSPKEHLELKAQVRGHYAHAELILYSIQEIPFRLIYYPGLADKYIPGVKTTQGTLYTLPDFINSTEKGLQPSLSNPFVGREEETNQAKAQLLSNDILIITGSQGVGKSKLAVHLSEIFEKEFGYEPRVIASSPVPLWDDLNTFILPSNKYFIFFDDANKALPNLDYLLQFINHRESGMIKIVITIRDYVRQDLNKYLFNIPYSEITIKHFDDKRISEMVGKFLPEGLSLEPFVMDRVLLLSKGNSRLALMATSAILNDNDVGILNDVFSLYDQYFQKVKNELSFLDNPNNLKALGLLSFFGVLDRNDERVKTLLEEHFNVNWNQLWEIFLELEKIELVDVFYNEGAKISDQVLATYVFHKTFIQEGTAAIDYSEWLVWFIDGYEKKVNRTLIDLINTFGFEELQDRITSLIVGVQKKLESDTKKLYKFLEIFWFYRQVDTLLFIRDWIESLDEEAIELDDIKYDYETNDIISPPEYLELLLNFLYHSTLYSKEAAELALKLMFRQPSSIPEIFKHVKTNIEFQRFDYRIDFERQLTFMEVLQNKSLSDREKTISDHLFLVVAPLFLDWDHHQIEGKGGGQLMIHNFHLTKTPGLMKLRSEILTRLFELFPKNEVAVLSVLNKYTLRSRHMDSRVYADEQPIMADFINKNLKPESYSHCLLVKEYVGLLKEHTISTSNDWNLFLNSDSMGLAKVFSSNFDDERLGHEELERKQKEEIGNYISGKDIGFIEKTLDLLDSIYASAVISGESYWIDSNLPYLFISLAETDPKLYYSSIELLMNDRYSFELSYGSFISVPLKKGLLQPKEIYYHINRLEYKRKQFWKQVFFDAIDERDIDEFFIQEFISFLHSAIGNFYLPSLYKYFKFDKCFNATDALLSPPRGSHKNFITYLIQILLSKADTVNIYFDHRVCQSSFGYFVDKPDLLKQIFYLQKRTGRSYDHNGEEMAAVSSLDNSFPIEYLRQIPNSTSLKLEKLNLIFIWKQPNFENVLDQALEIIIAKVPFLSSFEHPANVLFKGIKDPEELETVFSYISRFIAKHFLSKSHIQVIMNIIVYRFDDQLLRFFKELLILNKNPEFIKRLSLERNGVFSGSRVPKLESRIKFFKSLITMVKTLPNRLDYSEHIKNWELEIEWTKQDKQQELKNDFMEWVD